MVPLPLIIRELRVTSRKPAIYNERLGWGLTAVFLLAFFSWNFPGQIANGRYLLSGAHFWLAGIIFLVAPIGAADAISREKREGTLGLLLLTGLSPTEIVLGKLAVHFLRLIYISLIVLPFLALPMIIGGVTLQDFLVSFVFIIFLIAVGLTAGLIASSIFVSFGAALFWAMFFSLFLTVAISASAVNAAFELFPTGISALMNTATQIFIGPILMLFPVLIRQVFGTLIFTAAWPFIFVGGGLLLLSILLLSFAVWFCSRRVRRHAQFAGETKRQAAFRKKFLTPVLWSSTYRRWITRKLEKNPLIWLEYRTPWARAARWAMILVIILIETLLLVTLPGREDFLTTHFLFLAFLVTFLTFKSSSSFQNEKESGAFELLLVTPLTEQKLVTGRLRAVASYYALTVILLGTLGLFGFSWSQPNLYHENDLSPAVNFLSLTASLISVPITGLYFALRSRTFLNALIWTGATAVLIPICLCFAFNGLVWMQARHSPTAMAIQMRLREVWWPVLLAVISYHLLLAAFCLRATITLLRKREFGQTASNPSQPPATKSRLFIPAQAAKTIA